MSFELPDVPANLTACATASKSYEEQQKKTLKLYILCLEEVAKRVFPCRIRIESADKDAFVTKIIDKLRNAGYAPTDENYCMPGNDADGIPPSYNRYIIIYNPKAISHL